MGDNRWKTSDEVIKMMDVIAGWGRFLSKAAWDVAPVQANQSINQRKPTQNETRVALSYAGYSVDNGNRAKRNETMAL